jgi:hypothetical protein
VKLVSFCFLVECVTWWADLGAAEDEIYVIIMLEM